MKITEKMMRGGYRNVECASIEQLEIEDKKTPVHNMPLYWSSVYSPSATLFQCYSCTMELRT